jgi:ZIP family zinc transporter
MDRIRNATVPATPAGLALPGHRGWLFAAALLATFAAALLIAELARSLAGERWAIPQALHGALLGGTVAAGATALGAAPALLLARASERAEDIVLGFAAGVMLAASVFSLLVPAMEAGETLLGGRVAAALLAAAALAAGTLLMVAIDRTLPHEHRHAGRHGVPARLARVWLLVVAILIHNFPEGMAIGAAFAGGDRSTGVPVAAAIAIQNAPEGLVVALALRAIGYRPLPAVGIAAATGLVEPLGAVAASAVLSLAPVLHPFGLAAAAGAMLFVVSHEIIPETHRNGHALPATLGLLGGFVLMMVLDNAFTA